MLGKIAFFSGSRSPKHVGEHYNTGGGNTVRLRQGAYKLHRLLLLGDIRMQIRFVSSLTSEDEDRVAPAILAALITLLDQTTISYSLRIETSSDRSYQHHHQVPHELGELEAG